MSDLRMRAWTRPVAVLAAAVLLVVGSGLLDQPVAAKPPGRPGKVSGLTMSVTKPTSAYRLTTAWNAAKNATSYRVSVTNTSGVVLDRDTVSSPAWVATVTAPSNATVRLTVTAYNLKRKGSSASMTTVLPDLTAPTGSFDVSRSGAVATVTQTALADDVSPAAKISRVVNWADGSGPQAWASGLTTNHTYSGTGLWRPTVTLTDEHGNVAVVQLAAVVVGDTTAPTGAFAAGPSAAWASWSKVSLTQTALHDDFSDAANVARTVSWGDGTADTVWTGDAALQHVYAAAGTYTPSVTLVDEAGNSAVVAAASAVTVTRDTTAPKVTLGLPKYSRSSATSWRTLRGRATDAGTGVKWVRVRAVEKRGLRWYAYRPVTGTWTRCATRAAAWRTAGGMRLTTTAGAWHVTLKHLTRGVLLHRVTGRDNVDNVSRPLTHRARLTRR
ncbi:hypothetical protein [Nocardioides sp. LS1]|uniref:hypothetical protein n=1 Tax=Nocardioides sp. LS1 TaxID=1027620 RepID=UPI000F61EB1D|nr:hypothetical protein [Nocardioides sp. LS1]GCD91249.1 hypothetical protein NLS1_32550 [Nocardioides sp. LS1]